jgi:hypothetical protein
MKTNYESRMTVESKSVISKIADYAAGNMIRTKGKSELYSRIMNRCATMIGTSLPSS